jgi:phosphoserine phosphatase RsbU/P
MSRPDHALVPRSILVVDDDPRARKLMRVILEHAGYRVALAEDGESALAEFALHPAEIVIADLMMPGMDGIELLARLRREPFEPRPLLMLLTAMDTSETRAAAYAAGADDLMTKPVDRGTLLERLAALSNGAAGDAR